MTRAIKEARRVAHPLLGPPTIEATAYHEAGHAVVAACHGFNVHEVTIVPNGDIFGFTNARTGIVDKWSLLSERDQRDLLWRAIELDMAGCIAECIFHGLQYAMAGADFDHTLKLLRLYGQPGDVDSLPLRFSLFGLSFRRRMWRATKAVAQELIARRTVDNVYPIVLAHISRDTLREAARSHRLPVSALKAWWRTGDRTGDKVQP